MCKKSLTQPTAHEYNGVSQRGYPLPPLPPRGGGGEQESCQEVGMTSAGSKYRAKCASRSKKDFCDFSRLRAKISSVNARLTLRKKVKKNIRKMWTNLSLSSNLWAWKTKSNGRIWWTSKLTVALQRWLTSQAHSARC